MNNKLLPFIKNAGFCCVWAWLEANKRRYTSALLEEIGKYSPRALRYQRSAHRKGLTYCPNQANCLKAQLKSGHKIQVHPYKAPDSDAASEPVSQPQSSHGDELA